MNILVSTLDNRFNGFPYWKYAVSVPRSLSIYQAERVDLFVRWREWCWNTWGPSKELDFFYYTTNSGSCHNTHWCWNSDDDKRRIYLVDDSDLTAFTLVWG